jgi:hydroxymethylpyrimidine/phosphomethylpyrimidine kinase
MLPKQKETLPIVLSIAGHDPASGAGITADIKTIAAHGCYGVTCVTSLTVQSTRGVRTVQSVDGQFITDTLLELIADFSIAAVKVGMLGSAEVVRAVVAFLQLHPQRNVVLDPVLVSSSGTELLEREGVELLRDQLLPLVDVITPNIDEATALTGLTVRRAEDMQTAATRLHEMGARTIVVTGGHLSPAVDLLSLAPERAASGQKSSQQELLGHKSSEPKFCGYESRVLKQEKVITNSTHGTGCAFSTALACNLAVGKSLIEATSEAKQYVTSALKNAIEIGSGKGPINHLFKSSA